jgi:hypothetical protein
MAENQDWRDEAMAAYRDGWQALERSRERQRDIESCRMELQEALLDLKQATIAGDVAAVTVYMSEIKMVRNELQRLEGDS